MSEPNSFLYSVAEKIYSSHKDELESVLIVVPSTRAGRFVYNHLKTLINHKSNWLPGCLGISALVEKLANNSSIDRLELTLKLYSIHKKNNPNDTLEGFLKWGGTALTDFNEIENYLLDANQVFSDLRDIKSIDEWSFNEEELSKDQTQFLEFWTYLGTLKSQLDEELKKENLGYSGLIIRNAINELEKGHIPSQWKKIYFVGLNAISNSEKKLINQLQLENLAEIISDSDAYYHLNPIHEAGYFMRKQEAYFDIKHDLSDGFKGEKEINFIKANTVLGMPNIAASLVHEHSEHTAIILGDEKLLVPLLSNLPEEVKEANITMGYPLIDGLVWRGVDKLIQLKVELEKLKKVSLNGLLELSADPFVSTLLANATEFNHRAAQFQLQNRVKLTPKELNSLCHEEATMLKLFQSPNSQDLLIVLSELLEWAYERSENVSNFIKEQIGVSFKFLQRLRQKLEEVSELNQILNLNYFLSQLIGTEKVPFLGEPYGGIQIMGLLETRALDFKHVVFCGATDALMPAVASENSFMPFELKNHYGLPTNREKEAVFAHSFYRLCQRATTIDFIYVETEDGLVANEKSRFLKQLEAELPEYSQVKINYINAQSETESAQLGKLEIIKTDAHKEKIKELIERGISASAMNTFISCPADFYYKYVIGMKEPDKQDEVVHPSITGNILHNTLDELYKPYVKQVLSEEVLAKITKASFTELDRQVESEHLTMAMAFGENRLEYLVMRQKLSAFLSWELSEVKRLKKLNQYITIVSLEEKYQAAISGLELSDGTKVSFSGYIDRIDRIGETYRIIDYKSGIVEQTDLNLSSDLDFSTGKKGKALQLLIYALLIAETEPTYLASGFEVGNISLKKIKNGLMNIKVGEPRQYETPEITPEFLNTVKASMNLVFAEMIEGIGTFEHNSEALYCDFCIQ